MKNFKLIFATIIMVMFVMTSCTKDATDLETTAQAEQSFGIQEGLLQENPELLQKLNDAIENDEFFESELFTFTDSNIKYDGDGAIENRGWGPLAGCQILSPGPYGGLELKHGCGSTLYGYNVVDDFICNQFKDRFCFKVPSSSSARCIKLYTYDNNLNLASTKYIIVPSYCTRYSFLTTYSNYGIGSVQTCSASGCSGIVGPVSPTADY